MNKHLLYLIFLVYSVLAISAVSFASTFRTSDEDAIINQLYNILKSQPTQTISSRILQISEAWLGKAYERGALGEGEKGDFDQWPLYRFDAFDCETYVDTVLALALAQNPTTFKSCIRKIRYRDGIVSLLNRNHFTCLDWNRNNQRQGFFADITTTIHGGHHQPIVRFAKAEIDKAAWYHHIGQHQIRLVHASSTEIRNHLTLLNEKTKSLSKQVSTIPYLPLSILFDIQGKPNMQIFKQIPNAAIIELVRPNWDLTETIGTHLNVSHMGFAIWSNGRLLFRNASTLHQQVVEESLIDYLRQMRESPTVKGINVQVIKQKASIACTSL